MTVEEIDFKKEAREFFEKKAIIEKKRLNLY